MGVGGRRQAPAVVESAERLKQVLRAPPALPIPYFSPLPRPYFSPLFKPYFSPLPRPYFSPLPKPYCPWAAHLAISDQDELEAQPNDKQHQRGGQQGHAPPPAGALPPRHTPQHTLILGQLRLHLLHGQAHTHTHTGRELISAQAASSPPESAPPELAPPESAPPELAPPESAPPESAPPEPAPHY